MTHDNTTLPAGLRVALVHDYLREYGGAERVVEALHEIFPDAPLYVSFVDASVTGIHWPKFAHMTIYQSWLTKIPLYKKLFSPLRVWAPEYFSQFDLSEFDVVISSTNAYFSKAVKVKGDTHSALHICYCHTPARSLYGYTTRTNWQGNPVTKFLGTILNHYLRIRDVSIARDNVDYFIANSRETQRRISTFYRKNSIVIYPPIVVPEAAPLAQKNSKSSAEYFLCVGRVAASKHIDLAVQTATELGFNLKVVGDGNVEHLKSLAGETVEFLGGVDDAQLAQLYQDAAGLLYPAEDEDFGMVPIEAMGYGVPVIAHRSGGPLETIQEGKTGYLFDSFTVESLSEAIEKLRKTKWDKKEIHHYAKTFNVERFQREILAFVMQHLKKQKK